MIESLEKLVDSPYHYFLYPSSHSLLLCVSVPLWHILFKE